MYVQQGVYMAVLKSKRKIAKEEYERSFKEIYQYMSTCLSNVPKRRQKWICKPIYEKLNIIFNDIMEIDTGYFSKDTKYDEIEAIVKKCISGILSIQKDLIVLWCINKHSMRKMVHLAEMLNTELKLLNSMTKDRNNNSFIYVLDWNAIYNANFMKNMVLLHRNIHSKVVRSSKKDDYSYNDLFVKLIDDALFNLCEANKSIPKTSKEYETRRKHISTAISDLKKCQRPMLYFAFVHDYSKESLAEMTKMLNTELKLLYGVNKSDKGRFANL